MLDRLHRFAGSASERKLRLASHLAERLDTAYLPAPLDALVDAVEAAAVEQ